MRAADPQGRAGRRILGGIFNQMAQDAADKFAIKADGRHVFRYLYLDGAVPEQGLCFFESKIDDFAHALGMSLHVNAGGIELRHLDRLADEPVKACALFVDDGIHFATLRLAHLRLADKSGCGGANGCKRASAGHG